MTELAPKFAQQRAVIAQQQVRLVSESIAVGSHASHEPGKGEPRIELIRDGDIVRAIEVICSCGERIRLRCVYE